LHPTEPILSSLLIFLIERIDAIGRPHSLYRVLWSSISVNNICIA
jgi:hypothetical protein